MKKLYFSILAVLAYGAASAQLTLNQGSYSNMVITTDTFGEIDPPYPTLAPGAGQHFDFTNVFYGNTRYYSEQFTGSNTALPNATWYGTRVVKMGTADSLRVRTKRWSGITADGLMRIGEEADRHAVGLVYLGGNFVPADSMVILEQDVPYSAPYPLIKFPATNGSSWSAGFDLVLNMELTYGAQSYNKAPFVWKSHTDYNFTVPGDGYCQIKLFDESVTDSAAVLLERIGGTTTDSFFVNGSPAPAQLLTALGLQQGKTANNYFSELFRANEANALVLYTHGADANYSTVASNQVHLLRIPFRTSVESMSKDGKMALYPNPVGNERKLNIQLEAAAGNYSYRITQITGAVAATGSIVTNGSALSISLPATLGNGVYWLTLSNDKGEVSVAPFRLEE